MPTNCLSVFDHFVGLVLNVLNVIGYFNLLRMSEAYSELHQTSMMELFVKIAND